MFSKNLFIANCTEKEKIVEHRVDSFVAPLRPQILVVLPRLEVAHWIDKERLEKRMRELFLTSLPSFYFALLQVTALCQNKSPPSMSRALETIVLTIWRV